MSIKDDLKAMAFDAAAARRVRGEVARRRASNPAFTSDDLRREVELGGSGSAPHGSPETTLKRDLQIMAFDPAASKRVSAEVARRRVTNPQFTTADLRREIANEGEQPSERTPHAMFARMQANKVGTDLPANIRPRAKAPAVQKEDAGVVNFLAAAAARSGDVPIDEQAIHRLAAVAAAEVITDSDIVTLENLTPDVTKIGARMKIEDLCRVARQSPEMGPRMARETLYYFGRPECEAAGVDLVALSRALGDGPEAA